eukprot:10504923-Alexandrium_andersonii.AAC.1
MELHIRFQVPKGKEEADAPRRAADRQDDPADRAALDAAGFPDFDADTALMGDAAALRPGLLPHGQRALVAHLKVWRRKWRKKGQGADATVAAELGRASARGGRVPVDSPSATWLASRG